MASNGSRERQVLLLPEGSLAASFCGRILWRRPSVTFCFYLVSVLCCVMHEVEDDEERILSAEQRDRNR